MINAIRVSTVSMFQFSEGRLSASMGCLLSCCCGSEDDDTGEYGERSRLISECNSQTQVGGSMIAAEQSCKAGISLADPGRTV